MISKQNFLNVISSGIYIELHSMLDEVIDKAMNNNEWTDQLYKLYVNKSTPKFSLQIDIEEETHELS